MPKYKVVTERANYTATNIIEAHNIELAWIKAIESAVSSNETITRVTPVRYGIYCVRGAGSPLGANESWLKDKNNGIKLFDTSEAAEAEVDRIRIGIRSVNLSYFVQEYTDEE
jgi:hypothetical protein